MGSYFLIRSNLIYLFEIQIKNGTRVTEVYSIPMNLMTRGFLTFASAYNLGPNGTSGVLVFSSNIGVIV